MSPRHVFVLAALMPFSASAGVVASVWPGPAPCNTTLQACINATPDGSGVVVDSDATIDESLNLYNRSISVAAAYGRRPTLAAGNWITVTSAPILGNQTVTLRGLRLVDSYINATYSGLATATYDFSGLVLEQTSLAPTYLRIEGRTGNTVQAQVSDVRISARPRNLNAGLIEIANAGGTVNANVYYSDVRNTAPIATEGAGIFVDTFNGGGGTVKLHGNRVQGGFYRAGLFVSEGLLSTASSNFSARLYNNVVVCADNTSGGSTSGTGISFTVGNGEINGQAVNNTVTRCSTGIAANQWSGSAAGASISGLVKNNLIVGQRGLAFTSGLADGLTNDYNLLNVANNFTAPGPNTITADARLVSLTAPRLRMGSPAIDAADAATLGLGLIFNGLPTNDADGLRRYKGTGAGDPDIGAYEAGDRGLLHVATSANTTSGYITRIDNPVLDGQSAANPIATQHWNGSGSGVVNDNAYGIYYSASKWRLFNQDTTAMPVNAAFNVFVPAPGGGSLTHVSSAANISGSATRIDDSSVNNLPDRIVLVTQNWSAGSSIYNEHPVGLDYVAGGSGGEWRIVNLDNAAMPVGAGFGIYAQQASPNAFRVTAPAGGSSIQLDHPLLNDTACARPQVSRLRSAAPVPRNFDVYYGTGNGRWRIFSYTPLTAGAQFHVVIDPVQVFECSDRIFANGLQ